MTDMPETIWASGEMGCEWFMLDEKYSGEGALYTRTDIAQAEIDALRAEFAKICDVYDKIIWGEDYEYANAAMTIYGIACAALQEGKE